VSAAASREAPLAPGGCDVNPPTENALYGTERAAMRNAAAANNDTVAPRADPGEAPGTVPGDGFGAAIRTLPQSVAEDSGGSQVRGGPVHPGVGVLAMGRSFKVSPLLLHVRGVWGSGLGG